MTKQSDWEARYRGTSKALLKRARARAVRSNLPFDISEEDVTVPEYCPALGIPLFPTTGRGGGDNSPSLDRVIPELGYTRGNVVVISTRANRLKGNGCLVELLAICGWLAEIGSSEYEGD